jgi:predicted CoA-binding protein
MAWQTNLITKDADILALARSSQRVAVLGIRSEKRADRAAFYVPQYLVSTGVEVVPVPVYEKDVEIILGQQVYRDLVSIPGEIDLVDVFRRSEDIPAHLPDILAKKPKAVWFQLGIRNDAVAEELAKAGIKVVQDRCLMVDHRRSRI